VVVVVLAATSKESRVIFFSHLINDQRQQKQSTHAPL